MAERPREACFVFDTSFEKSQNCIFGPPYEVSALYLKVLMQRSFVVGFYQENVSFIRKTAK